MGQEIGRSRFTPDDFSRFTARLAEETQLLARLERERRLSEHCCTIGFEVEAWLVDRAQVPAPINAEFLAALASPLAVPELSRFNVELNGTPQWLRGHGLAQLEAELTATWRRCLEVSHGLGAALVLTGILPTVRESDLTLDNISALHRYRALNEQVLRQRGGAPLVVDIDGAEHFHTRHGDVMLEAATTSFQVHLQVPASRAARVYNASLMASGPVLAAGVNSPFLFGRRLWQETRVPLFEQAVAVRPPGADPAERRVSFGRGYLENGVHALFADNLAHYPVLLPVLGTAGPEALEHLRMHNGTIWRWNRPLIGVDPDGGLHLRIEHRVLPAGPSVADMAANAALYAGLANALAACAPALEDELPFDTARANFYAAARHGLSAGLAWPGHGTLPAAMLLRQVLLPLARTGLRDLAVDDDDAGRYLDIIEQRVRSGQTGAAWQTAWVDAHGPDFPGLSAAYLENQRSGAPVHEWPR